MGVVVNKENTKKSELSRKIDADLEARRLATLDVDGGEDVDFAEDSEYMKNMQKTGRFSWIWIVLILLATLSAISIVFL